MNEPYEYMAAALYLGHPGIDAQHEILFVCYRELMHAVGGHGDGFELTDVISVIKSYVVTHFRYEEDAMQSTDYLDRDMHIAEHRRLEKGLLSLSERYENETDKNAVAIDMAGFLKEWLSHHIAVVDRLLAQHLNSLNYT
ncbi:MAG: hemerythrin family protein [Magnetococcales bacterium]|nr:hemerythrin family protein [Magnetococcales bacterium]